MINRLVVLFCLVFSVFSASAAERYRWEDAQGNVNYSDLPPPADARNVTRTDVRNEKSESQLPYPLQLAVDKFPVTLYVTECGKPCDLARALLVERGVPHTMLDPMQPKPREALLALTGGKLEVPVVQVGKTVLRGFEVGQWNSALDAARYPSTAMIKVTPTVPAAETPDSADAQAQGRADTDSSGTQAADASSSDTNATEGRVAEDGESDSMDDDTGKDDTQ